jgi:aspartate racemase
MKTIGIVGGVTWRSTATYYRILNEEVSSRLGGSHSARIVLYSVDFAEHHQIQETAGWDGVVAELADIGGKLKQAGADFLILAANTLHIVAAPVEAAVGLPVLHVADATAAAVKARGLRTVGLLGTRFTMTGDFVAGRMAERHALRVIVPAAEGIREIDRIIYEELTRGRFEAPAKRTCLDQIDRLTAAGAEGIVLGCTELPLLVQPPDTPAVLFDTAALHARAAVDLALAD